MWHFLQALQQRERQGVFHSWGTETHNTHRLIEIIFHTHLHEPRWSSFMNTFESCVFHVSFHSCVFIVDSRRRDPPTHSHTHTPTHIALPLRYFTLFILCRLILGRHFLWSQFMSAVRQASPLRCLSSYLLCLMSLSPATCALNETMVLSSNEQWVCQVLKGEEDKWWEGTRVCEDNGFLWWLTFQSSASKKVWLSYCVFTGSQMNGGLGAGFVCGTEGNKHTMSNLHLGCRGVSVCLSISTCITVWTESDTFTLFFYCD